MPNLQDIIYAVENIQHIMIAYATDGRTPQQPKDYHVAYVDLAIQIEEAGYANPNPYKTNEAFWQDCGGTWAERRRLVSEIYGGLLFDILRRLRKQRVPRNWQSTDEALTDALAPVRVQWLKAKNFISATPPDYENSIKESVNSIESCLKILLDKRNGTLGKLAASARLDPDIERLITTTYGLVSNRDIVRHGGTALQDIGELEATFFLEFAATAIVYIKAKMEKPQPGDSALHDVSRPSAPNR
jgi:hypothetical protein